MSPNEVWIAIGLLVWGAWLIWHGRANSPRRRREQARARHLIEQAVREQAARGEIDEAELDKRLARVHEMWGGPPNRSTRSPNEHLKESHE